MKNSILNFDPINIITNLSMQNTTICYFILIIAVIVLSIFLSKLCVILKDKTKISEAAIGAILLGIITSFPELITSIASIFLPPHNGFIAVGDIIGSNLFDLFVLAIFLFCFMLNKKTQRLDKSNFIAIICMLINAIFCFLSGALFKYEINGFNVFTIAFFCLFAINTIWFIKTRAQPNPWNKINKQEKNISISFLSKWPLWLVILTIIMTSLCLVASSYFLTLFAIQINTYLKLDNAFSGAILLGIVTSLPEIITCTALAFNKQYNMVIGNIVGSVNFNFFILFIANVILTSINGGQMFSFFSDINNKNISWQILFFLIQSVFMLLYAFSNYKKTYKNKKNAISISFKFVETVAIALCYLSFIAVSQF